MFGFSKFINIAQLVLPIIGLALIFQKCGIKWWKSLIPFYNEWLLLNLVNRSKVFIAYVIATVVVYLSQFWLLYERFIIFGGKLQPNIFPITMNQSDAILVNFRLLIGCLPLIAIVTLFCVRIILSIGLGNAFTLPTWMVVLLVLFPSIFLFIVGISNSYRPEWWAKQYAAEIEHTEIA